MTYRNNPNIAKKYKSKRWQRLRQLKITINPLCERCLKNGIYNATEIIHHKDYVTDKNYNDDNIFFNIDNLESLCFDCHQKEHFAEKQEYEFDENGDLVKNE